MGDAIARGEIAAVAAWCRQALHGLVDSSECDLRCLQKAREKGHFEELAQFAYSAKA